MKYRWLTVAGLAGALVLAGCAPAQTGDTPSAEASVEADADAGAESQDAAPSMDASPDDSGDGGNSEPDDYDY